jgi:hypothetical protein
VCCEEGKLSSSTFPLSSLLKWIFFAARRHSSTPREERTTEHERERERERERKDSFGCRKNQHFIQNPHIKKKKKALVVGGEKNNNNNNNTIYKILTLRRRRRRRRSNRSKTRKKHGK